MEELVKNLSGVWYLATAEDGQPHVRPFDKAAEVGGKLYIGTTNTKKVYEQIKKNPKIEIYAPTDFVPCRFEAQAFIEENADVAEEAFDKMGKAYDPETSIALRLENIKK